MGWEHYIEPIPAGGIITPEMVRELWEAFDERLRAVRDEGSGVHFAQSPSEYISTRIVYDDNFAANEGNTRNDALGGAVLLLARGHYVYEANGAWQRFAISGEDTVIFRAAIELGYTEEEANELANDATNASFRIRSSHVFNVIRKALQLMDRPSIRRLDFSLNPGVQKNAIDSGDDREIRSGSDETSWEVAKDDYFAEEWADGVDQASAVARLQATQNSACAYFLIGQRFRGDLDLATVWGKGYRMYMQYRTPSLASSQTFESGDILFRFAGEPQGSRALTTPEASHVDEIADHWEDETPPLDPRIEVDLEPAEVRAELDNWPAPTHSNCNAVTEDRVLAASVPTGSARPLFFAELKFDYGEDPDP